MARWLSTCASTVLIEVCGGVGGVRSSAIFNPFVGRFYVDDKYGVIKDKTPGRDEPCR